MIRLNKTIGRAKPSSILKKTPKAEKKINSYYYNKGLDRNLSAKQMNKCLKSESNKDFIAGIDSASLDFFI